MSIMMNKPLEVTLLSESCNDSPKSIVSVLGDSDKVDFISHSLSLDISELTLDKTSLAWSVPKLEENEKSNHLIQPVVCDLRESQEQRDLSQTAESWNALGLVRLHTQQNPQGALECHEMALHLIRKDSLNKAITLNDIGLCYERLNEYDQAMDTYRQALDIMNGSTADSHPRKLSLERTIARLRRS